MFTKLKIMDSQFNTLARSYHDNYVQYKITGSQSNQNAYMAAETGIKNILNSLQQQVDEQKSEISNFYNSDVEDKLRDTRTGITKYQKKIVRTEDEIEAAKLRGEAPPVSPPTQMPLMGQYIALATLGAIALGLMVLR